MPSAVPAADAAASRLDQIRFHRSQAFAAAAVGAEYASLVALDVEVYRRVSQLREQVLARAGGAADGAIAAYERARDAVATIRKVIGPSTVELALLGQAERALEMATKSANQARQGVERMKGYGRWPLGGKRRS